MKPSKKNDTLWDFLIFSLEKNPSDQKCSKLIELFRIKNLIHFWVQHDEKTHQKIWFSFFFPWVEIEPISRVISIPAYLWVLSSFASWHSFHTDVSIKYTLLCFGTPVKMDAVWFCIAKGHSVFREGEKREVVISLVIQEEVLSDRSWDTAIVFIFEFSGACLHG